MYENNNVSLSISSVDRCQNPKTICVTISFWVSPINKGDEKPFILKKKLHDMIRSCYDIVKKNRLIGNHIFPIEKKNIFIINIPMNFNYNNKKNFISVELYMHTLNVLGVNKLPYRPEVGNQIYDEAMSIGKDIISMDVFSNNYEFQISKSN